MAKLSINEEAQLAPPTKLSVEVKSLKPTVKSQKTVEENIPIASSSLKGSMKQAPSPTKVNLHLLLKKAIQEHVSKDLSQRDTYINELGQQIECPSESTRREKDPVTAMNQHLDVEDTTFNTESRPPSLMSRSENNMWNDSATLVDSTASSTLNVTEGRDNAEDDEVIFIGVDVVPEQDNVKNDEALIGFDGTQEEEATIDKEIALAGLDTLQIQDTADDDKVALIVFDDSLEGEKKDEDLEVQKERRRASEHLQGQNLFVFEFLISRDEEFERVAGFRTDGWQSELGDTVFKKARQKADNTDRRGEQSIYQMMKDIAEEMQTFAGIYTPRLAEPRPLNVLDICCAPGGYSAVAMKYNPDAHVYGITLAEELNGHPIQLGVKEKFSGLKYCDLTTFSKEFSDRPIPKDHPDYKNFSSSQPFRSHKFDLVFCDGNVLRTHERPDYRKERDVERPRLNLSQLILAMQRINPGGTMVMLLQKIDYWDSVYLLFTFNKFSSISVFKPKRAYKHKGSFYLIAKGIQPELPSAKEALKEWRDGWWKATVERVPLIDHDRDFVEKILEEFGEKLIELGRPLWRIQADALKATPYAGGRGWD